MQAEEPVRDTDLPEKKQEEKDKDKTVQQVPINPRLKSHLDHRSKVSILRQKIPESSSARKDDINTLLTSGMII